MACPEMHRLAPGAGTHPAVGLCPPHSCGRPRPHPLGIWAIQGRAGAEAGLHRQSQRWPPGGAKTSLLSSGLCIPGQPTRWQQHPDVYGTAATHCDLRPSLPPAMGSPARYLSSCPGADLRGHSATSSRKPTCPHPHLGPWEPECPRKVSPAQTGVHPDPPFPLAHCSSASLPWQSLLGRPLQLLPGLREARAPWALLPAMGSSRGTSCSQTSQGHQQPPALVCPPLSIHEGDIGLL